MFYFHLVDSYDKLVGKYTIHGKYGFDKNKRSTMEGSYVHIENPVRARKEAHATVKIRNFVGHEQYGT